MRREWASVAIWLMIGMAWLWLERNPPRLTADITPEAAAFRIVFVSAASEDVN